ncbi:MAG: hypothetical protein AB7M12_07515 [Hyphomonadaceae bacterium]
MRFSMRQACAAGLLVVLAACGAEPGGTAGSGGGASGAGGAGPPPIDEKKEIAALGAPASPETRALYEGDFEAVGQEPDWRLGLFREWVSFSRPGLQEVGGVPGRKDVGEKGARIVAGPVIVTLSAGECVYDDEQPAEKFPYKAQVSFDGVEYDGCARRASSASAASERWIARIAELLPAIDACLARVDNKPAGVTIAYVNGEQTSVRLLDAEGGRYECSAPNGGGAVDYWGSLADRDVLQGERDPLFVRAPAPAPKGPCVHNEAAKNAAGGAIGWYSTTSC